MKAKIRQFLFLFLFCSLVGCGASGPELVSVKGTLNIDGAPAEGVMIRFIPNVIDEAVKAPSSQAITDAEGKFELYTTDNRPGVVRGNHKVSLVDTLVERVAQGQTSTQPVRLSPKFSKPGAMEITIDGPNDELLIEATK